MAFLLQATATVPDWERFRAAVGWLHETIEHPPGFRSFRVVRGHGDPTQVSILEEWDSFEDFTKALEQYDQSHRPEFLKRAGIDAETFQRHMWADTELPVVTA